MITIELPIKIIIVFFVALVAGTVFLQFSRNLIESSEQNLQDAVSDSSEAERVLQVGDDMSDSEMAYMAEECRNMFEGETGRKHCFAIYLNESSLTLPGGGAIEAEWNSLGYASSNLSISEYDSSKDYAFIYYMSTTKNVTIINS